MSASHVEHPETCCMSTAELPSGRVSSRMVYMKELDNRGWVVYSNFGTSRKGSDLATNPWVSLTFWWAELQRQVRIEGKAERLAPEESQKYFDTRIRGSRLGAWASKQSAPLEPQESGTPENSSSGGDHVTDDGRLQLDGWVNEVEMRFKDQDHIPVPPFWGGLRVVPTRVEFWQGRPNRLHDRFVYDLFADGKWKIQRLSP